MENAANAIGLSLYNFLNILNINQIWFYGRSCGFGERWLNTINRQTGFNPFDSGDGLKMNATQINFGELTRAQQVMGMGYLYVEDMLAGEYGSLFNLLFLARFMVVHYVYFVLLINRARYE